MSDQAPPVTTPNRRAHPRYALRVTGSLWCLTRAAGPCAATATDISLGGMMLHTSAPDVARMEPGDEVLLGFPEPGAKTRISFKARIRWKQRGLMTLVGDTSLGVEFRGAAEAEIRKLLGPAERGEPLPEPPDRGTIGA